jgi:hypothetical protein
MFFSQVQEGKEGIMRPYNQPSVPPRAPKKKPGKLPHLLLLGTVILAVVLIASVGVVIVFRLKPSKPVGEALGQGPWHTEGAQILDANNQRVRIAGVNYRSAYHPGSTSARCECTVECMVYRCLPRDEVDSRLAIGGGTRGKCHPGDQPSLAHLCRGHRLLRKSEWSTSAQFQLLLGRRQPRGSQRASNQAERSESTRLLGA